MNDTKPTDPIMLLKEIEAFISFRMLGTPPTFEPLDMRGIQDAIKACLKANGREDN